MLLLSIIQQALIITVFCHFIDLDLHVKGEKEDSILLKTSEVIKWPLLALMHDDGPWALTFGMGNIGDEDGDRSIHERIERELVRRGPRAYCGVHSLVQPLNNTHAQVDGQQPVSNLSQTRHTRLGEEEVVGLRFTRSGETKTRSEKRLLSSDHASHPPHHSTI
jgi:hypothetical protein